MVETSTVRPRVNEYDLVLMNMDNGRGQRDKFCDDLRSATPPQRLAFLVGQQEYLADSPNANEELVPFPQPMAACSSPF